MFRILVLELEGMRNLDHLGEEALPSAWTNLDSEPLHALISYFDFRCCRKQVVHKLNSFASDLP
jgi:hypothetical protein